MHENAALVQAVLGRWDPSLAYLVPRFRSVVTAPDPLPLGDAGSSQRCAW